MLWQPRATSDLYPHIPLCVPAGGPCDLWGHTPSELLLCPYLPLQHMASMVPTGSTSLCLWFKHLHCSGFAMRFAYVFISLCSLGPSMAWAESGALPDTQGHSLLLINIDPKPILKGRTRGQGHITPKTTRHIWTMMGILCLGLRSSAVLNKNGVFSKLKQAFTSVLERIYSI